VSGSRSWGWLDHLRSGGTTPWAEWDETASSSGARIPSAQHLELLRRVNLAAGGRLAPGMADRLLAAPTTGRGRGDLGLSGEAASAFGPAPVDPGTLTADDVLRVAAAALTRELVTAGPGARRVEPLRRVRLVRRWRRTQRVELLAGPYDAVLADAWNVACFSGTVRPWAQWLRRAHRQDTAPPRADLVGIAAHWARVAGPDRVVVHTSPGLSALPTPAARSAAAGELARHVRMALSTAVPPEQRAALLAGPLLTWLGRLRGDVGPPAGVPTEVAGWAATEATRQRDGLLAAGYEFVGDPDLLRPTAEHGTMPTAQAALDLAVRLLVMRGESS